VSKVVNHSGFYDKHNCPQRDSIPGPRALQSDHCDLNILISPIRQHTQYTTPNPATRPTNLQPCIFKTTEKVKPTKITLSVNLKQRHGVSAHESFSETWTVSFYTTIIQDYFLYPE